VDFSQQAPNPRSLARDCRPFIFRLHQCALGLERICGLVVGKPLLCSRCIHGPRLLLCRCLDCEDGLAIVAFNIDGGSLFRISCPLGRVPDGQTQRILLDLGSAVWAVAIVGLSLYAFSQGALQRVCDAVREDELVASSMGIDVARVKLLTFAAGALIAGLAGALYGHYMKFVRPENFDVLLSIYVVLYVVLGGVNNLWGPVLGALVMTLLPEYIRVLADWRPTVFGLAILVILLVRPKGILQFRTRTHTHAESIDHG